MAATLEALLERNRLRRRLPDPDVRRILRVRAGLSQAELGELVGVDRSAVSRWESGQRTPEGVKLFLYFELLERLAKAAT